jgi:hypothetical protein
MRFSVLDYVMQMQNKVQPQAFNERWRLKTETKVTEGRCNFTSEKGATATGQIELGNQKNCRISQRKNPVDCLHSHLLSSLN